VAGHVRLELRNVVTKYPFERSHRFARIQPNSRHRDHSRLSCGAGEAQLIGDMSAALGQHSSSLDQLRCQVDAVDPAAIRVREVARRPADATANIENPVR
jgi:hypothetical protein